MTEAEHPASVLRRAAQKLQRLAMGATSGAWTIREEHGRDIADEGWSDVRVTSAKGDIAVTFLSHVHENDRANGDAEYIAAMRPEFALAVALWLYGNARDADDICELGGEWYFGYCDSPAEIQEALKVARVFFGEPEPEGAQT